MKSWMYVTALGMVLLSGCASLNDDTTISLASDTYFDTGSADVKNSARSELQSVANRIKINQLTITGIRIEGNTDSVGDPAYNLDLSKRRALAVVNELVNNGISANMMTAHGNGETKPVAANNTDSGRAANRRVDIIIKGRLLF